MLVSDFDYELPPERIAQEPPACRDGARLMVLPRKGTGLEHRRILELPELLRSGDLLIFNDTRVIPARMVGHKVATGGRVELLLMEALVPGASEPIGELAPQREGVARGAVAGSEWRALAGSSKPLRLGAELAFDSLRAWVTGLEGEGVVRLGFELDASGLLEVLRTGVGQLPLPPYLERPGGVRGQDLERYQTLFAKVDGAVAAPTAGLHFSTRLLASLEQRGVSQGFVTLHVGPGTFLPVRADRLEDHQMHEERYEIGEAVVAQIAQCKHQGGRVICVGTTSLRAVESAARAQGTLRPGAGRTRLFLKPGSELSLVDGLLTNFHLPRSTLMMLVASLIGRERLLEAYAEAIAEEYRFFSYGDAMLIH